MWRPRIVGYFRRLTDIPQPTLSPLHKIKQAPGLTITTIIQQRWNVQLFQSYRFVSNASRGYDIAFSRKQHFVINALVTNHSWSSTCKWNSKLQLAESSSMYLCLIISSLKVSALLNPTKKKFYYHLVSTLKWAFMLYFYKKYSYERIKVLKMYSCCRFCLLMIKSFWNFCM